MDQPDVSDEVPQLPVAEMLTSRAKGPTAQEEDEKSSLDKIFYLIWIVLVENIEYMRSMLIEMTNSKSEETNKKMKKRIKNRRNE